MTLPNNPTDAFFSAIRKVADGLETGTPDATLERDVMDLLTANDALFNARPLDANTDDERCAAMQDIERKLSEQKGWSLRDMALEAA